MTWWAGKSATTTTDLQERLRFIADECKKMEYNPPLPVEPKHLAELAHYIGYLAKIVEKHFQTQEV